MSAGHIVILVVAGIACVWDLRTRRIPNLLTFGTAAAALVFQFFTRGTDGLVMGLGGWLVGVAVFFAAFALGGMGAGDVKLLGALGAWLGPYDAVWLALYTGVAGGIIALCWATLHGYLSQALRNVWTLLGYWRLVGLRPMTELTLDAGRGPRLAFGTSILAGTIVTVWLR
jgi:prepilin peptidase CpaA